MGTDLGEAEGKTERTREMEKRRQGTQATRLLRAGEGALPILPQAHLPKKCFMRFSTNSDFW